MYTETTIEEPKKNTEHNSYNSKKPFILKVLFIFVVVLIVVGGFFVWSWYSQERAGNKNPQNKVIAKVGEELLYQTDLNIELTYYPTKDEAARKLLITKMVEDSKLLQEAKKDQTITIDKTIYNSPNKNYLERIKVIQRLKTENAKMNAGLMGSIISVWFLNDRVGPLGYDKAKALALEKITYLHEQVKSGKSTMEQAAENIKNDSSFALLDPTSYKTNAIFYFNVALGEKITREDGFDQMLWGLSPGEVSAIYTANATDYYNNGQILPGYYIFGQAEKKKASSKKETIYEVKYY